MNAVEVCDIVKFITAFITISIVLINIGMHIKAQKNNFSEVEKIKKDILDHKNSVRRMLYRDDGSTIFTRAEKTDTLEKQLLDFQTESRLFQQHVLTTLAEIITKLDVVISDKAFQKAHNDKHYKD